MSDPNTSTTEKAESGPERPQPPVTKYELTVVIHGNSHEEIEDELLGLTRGGYLLASDYHKRDQFDVTTGRGTRVLRHTNPEQTPENYRAELDAWWVARKFAANNPSPEETPMKNLHAFTSHRDNTRRYFATYRIKGDDLRRIEGHVEVAFRPKLGKGGFRFHLGDRGSETPVDGMVDLGRVAVFWGVNAPGLGRLCELIGHGHKRDLSVEIHGGSLWWKLWYDDDGGMDTYHRCDSWRQPKVWPWSRGRRKHRGWMCLRDGNIDLNPLDALWGHRYFEYEDVEKVDALVPVGEFPGDEYVVSFKLQKQSRARRFGPSWARRRTDEGWVAAWECRPGIPVRNHSWKGDEILASAERVSGPAGWLAEAVGALAATVKKDRRHYRYNPPTASSENRYSPGPTTAGDD